MWRHVLPWLALLAGASHWRQARGFFVSPGTGAWGGRAGTGAREVSVSRWRRFSVLEPEPGGLGVGEVSVSDLVHEDLIQEIKAHAGSPRVLEVLQKAVEAMGDGVIRGELFEVGASERLAYRDDQSYVRHVNAGRDDKQLVHMTYACAALTNGSDLLES
jgi:hypothetical protein